MAPKEMVSQWEEHLERLTPQVRAGVLMPITQGFTSFSKAAFENA
jgi:hypothetical protein